MDSIDITIYLSSYGRSSIIHIYVYRIVKPIPLCGRSMVKEENTMKETKQDELKDMIIGAVVIFLVYRLVYRAVGPRVINNYFVPKQ